MKYSIKKQEEVIIAQLSNTHCLELKIAKDKNTETRQKHVQQRDRRLKGSMKQYV